MQQLPTTLNYEATLYSCDIERLHTTIPTDLGLEAISYWLNDTSNLIVNRFSKDFVLELLEFILKNNNFKFDEIFYN